MVEGSRLSKWRFVLGLLALLVMVLGFGYQLWKDGLLGGGNKASLESHEPEWPDLESLEGRYRKSTPQSPEKPDAQRPLRVIVEVTPGAWHSRDAFGDGWKFESITGIKVDESGEGDGLFGVELKIIGSEPCRLLLAPGQTGVCGEYAVALVDVGPETTATLALTRS